MIFRRNYNHLIVYSTCVLILILGLGAGGFGNKHVVNNPSSKADWVAWNKGVVVWSIADGQQRILIQQFNHDAIESGRFDTTFPGFKIDSICLMYSDSSNLEFLFWDLKQGKRIMLRLNREMIADYVSKPFKITDEFDIGSQIEWSPKYLESVLSYSRLGKSAYILQLDSSQKQFPALQLHKYNYLQNKNYTIFNRSWNVNLSTLNIEFARIVRVDAHRLYVYVNRNTNLGEQYLYCLDAANGATIYCTKLEMKGTQACLFSTCYYDSASSQIIIAGTTLLKPINRVRGLPHLFVMKIDPQGKITGSFHREVINLWYGPQTEKEASSFQYARNAMTYSRCVNISLESPNLIGLWFENYSLVAKDTITKGSQFIKLIDNDYHFLGLQHVWLRYDEATISPYCISCTDRKILYNPIWHLDSLGFDLDIEDRRYSDDINRLTYNSGPLYYSGSSDSKNNLKVLIRFGAHISSTKKEVYMKSQISGIVNAAAIVEFFPVSKSDISRKQIIRDDSTLFTLFSEDNNISVRITNW